MFKAWVGFALAVGSTGDFVQPEKSNNANRQVNDIFMEVDSAMLSNSASLFRVIFGPLPRSSAIFFRRSESWKNRQGNEVYGGYGTPLKLIAPAAAPLDPVSVGKSSFAERASAKVKLLFAHWLVATRDEHARTITVGIAAARGNHVYGVGRFPDHKCANDFFLKDYIASGVRPAGCSY